MMISNTWGKASQRSRSTPDVRKKLQGQSRWLTLLEAIEHIRKVEKCTVVAAESQLKDQIAEETIPVKWADGRGRPKDLGHLQNSKFIHSGQGLAADTDSYRPLYVLRTAVVETWPPTGRNAKKDKTKTRSNKGHEIAGGRKEPDRWMTLVRAIEHIQVAENCDTVEALRQLKQEIGDRAVGIKWADSRGYLDRPDAKRLSSTQLIPTGPGFAPDGDDEPRPLLVRRAPVLQLWPKADVGSASVPGNDDPTPKAGRPSAREEIRATLDEMANEGLSVDCSQKEPAKEIAKRRNATLGARGWNERTVYHHIAKWQADRKSNASDPTKAQK
jgi:hypothetical protein